MPNEEWGSRSEQLVCARSFLHAFSFNLPRTPTSSLFSHIIAKGKQCEVERTCFGCHS